MRAQFAPKFLKKLKIQRVLIRKSFKEKIEIFTKDHENPGLHNYPLRREWMGYRSIDITADYRAVFEVTEDSDGPVAYFVAPGTHQELYG